MSTSDKEGMAEEHDRKAFDTLAWNDPEDGGLRPLAAWVQGFWS
jgi:hypothetical protein